MSIERRVKLVEDLFHELDQETTQFTKSSGLKCISGYQASGFSSVNWQVATLVNPRERISNEVIFIS